VGNVSQGSKIWNIELWIPNGFYVKGFGARVDRLTESFDI
jgi:hypothetical protein